MALQKTPDGKYTYDSNDPAQVEAVVVLYEDDAKEKARKLLKRAAQARGETVDDAPAPAATSDTKGKSNA